MFRVKQSPHHSLSSPAQPDSLYMQSLSPPSPAHTGLAAEPQTCLSTFQLAFPTFFKPLLFQKGIFHCLVTLSFPTLIDTMDCSPPGSSVHGIFRQKYWSGLPFSPPGYVPDPWIKPPSLCLLHCRQILYPLNIREAVLLFQKGIF